MRKTQIYLTEHQYAELAALSKTLGKKTKRTDPRGG